ncbi:integrator complex subunit 7 isoform X2 [Arctopsyche grandis]|uniref:integrator complex subunit 7 isoform X2 n=1 Tax=Arctopsyche grandis TaxID=121162 RepID=UPI00406D881B
MRFTAFGDAALGEPEQDANSALTELDKGLRSGRVGEQCEAIVRFPRLFEKYPFPILINSSFLKLSDVFRMGNNFLRLWVLRVCQQSEKHLDKILNIDEFVRRVFSVIHSNDPVARALTLKTLGAVAAIIPERQNVHHAIRRGLDSHDSVEVEAAIYAASNFAAQSKAFAISMCNKISEMIRGQATPAGLKLQLVPALRHMHHDAAAARPVRALLTRLLPSMPAAPFVRLMLHTLTDLAASTLIDIPDQVTLLLEQVGAARASVRNAAVVGLRKLARSECASLWPAGAAHRLALEAISLTDTDPATLARCLGVIELLMKEPVMVRAHMHPDSKVRELCCQCIYSENLLIASKAAHILTIVSVYCFQESLPVHDIEELIIGLESIIIITGQGEDANNKLYQLKLTLKCVVQICEWCEEHCTRLVTLVGNEIEEAKGQRVAALASALGALGARHPAHALTALPSVLRRLSSTTPTKQDKSKSNEREDVEMMDIAINNPEKVTDVELDTIVVLCTVIFQVVAGHVWPPRVLAAVEAAVAPTNLWVHFRVARAAMRYGQHSVGANLLSELPGRAGSELAHHWLGALHTVAKAEATLQASSQQNLQEALRNATTYYHQAMAALKAGWSGGQCAVFQWEYVRVRGEMLGALARVLSACRAFCAQPPPAIALTQAQNSRDEFLRCGHITQQLRRAATEFKGLAESYCRLYQTSFDADPPTLDHLQILQQICSLMAQSMERISTASLQEQGVADFIHTQNLSNSCLESQLLIATCQKLNDISAKMTEPQDMKPIITHRQVECVWQQAATICHSPLPLPRFLFQPLQTTAVRLAITPQPRAPADHHPVPCNHHLSVKVEGVIQTGPRAGLFRKASAVQLTLTAHVQRPPDSKSEQPAPFVTLTERLKPAHDFFSTQLLVSMSGATGQSTTSGGTSVLIAVDAALLDETGALWRTGPRHTLNVKVLEDLSAKSAQSQAARRF